MLRRRRDDEICEMCDSRGIATLNLIDGDELWVCGECDPENHRGPGADNQHRSIRVVIARPGKAAFARRVWDDFRLFDRIIGGESATLTAVLAGNASDYVMVTHRNDETGLPANRSIDGNPIRGTFIVSGLGSEDHGLSDADTAKVKAALNE